MLSVCVCVCVEEYESEIMYSTRMGVSLMHSNWPHTYRRHQIILPLLILTPGGGGSCLCVCVCVCMCVCVWRNMKVR